ncbi:hypothetical protein ABI59_08450 [Acidobacteria bacterium Mor1]|nr:hypothetical protein ABI59_08450 [Acidobacteria bacterium Mor1]
MIHRVLATSLTILLLSLPCAAADMADSGDHARIPRVSGSEIIGFDQVPYDAGAFLSAGDDKKPAAVHAEGARTRILYLNKSGDTPLMVQKNYETALADLGDVEEVYVCRNDCSGHILSTTFWTRETMLPTDGLKHPFYLLGFAHTFKTPSYRYARVTTDSARYHVGVFSSVIADNNSNKELAGRTVSLIEIVEIKDFKATLEFIDAGQMRDAIGEKGHVALYGIQFDTDKADLRAESDATLAEIVKVLNADRSMRLYVVGHTDDVGALDYNQDLSLRRARSVVQALVSRGVDGGRLHPLGVGPAAPVAGNESEDGRALNRRVELVRRK